MQKCQAKGRTISKEAKKAELMVANGRGSTKWKKNRNMKEKEREPKHKQGRESVSERERERESGRGVQTVLLVNVRNLI